MFLLDGTCMNIFDKFSVSQFMLHASCLLGMLATAFPTATMFFEGETGRSMRHAGTSLGLLVVAFVFFFAFCVFRAIGKAISPAGKSFNTAYFLLLAIYAFAFTCILFGEILLLIQGNLSFFHFIFFILMVFVSGGYLLISILALFRHFTLLSQNNRKGSGQQQN